MGAKKNAAREGDTRASLAHSVSSCAHHFQAPATQARLEPFVQRQNCYRTPLLLLFHFNFCFT